MTTTAKIAKGYSRIEVHSGPDSHGRYCHTRYWLTDYKPGHPDGEYVTREVGQVLFAPLPPRTLPCGCRTDGSELCEAHAPREAPP